MSGQAAPTRRSFDTPEMDAADTEAVHALLVIGMQAWHRIHAAVLAGRICRSLGSDYRFRVGQALELARRGQIRPAEAALDVMLSEHAAMARKPLLGVRYDIRPVPLPAKISRPAYDAEAEEYQRFMDSPDGPPPWEDEEPEGSSDASD